MTVQELIDELSKVNPEATVFIGTPLPTEIQDCEITGVAFEDTEFDRFAVWLQWPKDNIGSGMSDGEQWEIKSGYDNSRLTCSMEID